MPTALLRRHAPRALPSARALLYRVAAVAGRFPRAPLGRHATRRRAVAAAATPPPPSKRAAATDDPVIVATKRLMADAGRDDVVSLAQGVVHWAPPPAAAAAAAAAGPTRSAYGYGPAAGDPALVAALQARLAEAGVPGGDRHEVMVTAGANQAFVNFVLAAVDADDPVVVFAPFYFNHVMCLQMTGGADRVVCGPVDPTTLAPDVDWLRSTLATTRIRAVVVVNPCNPTGAVLDKGLLQELADMTAAAGSWLVLDETYDSFTFAGATFHSISAPHIVHISSLSKAYGMAGWRVGALATHPDAGLTPALLKIQDTVAICAPQASQQAALAALTAPDAGTGWVRARVASLEPNRAAVAAALAPLAEAAGGASPLTASRGAIYLWAPLPAGLDDRTVVAWLVKQHGVCLIPGSACGAPGHVRAAFANLAPGACAEAAARLAEGVRALVEGRGP